MNSLNIALATEVLRAMKAEADTNIALATTSEKLNNEINTRAQLSLTVGSETQRAMAMELNINIALATLTERLNNEINARTDLNAIVTAEVARAQAAELAVNSSLNTEILRAVVADISAVDVSNPTAGSSAQEFWTDCALVLNEQAGYSFAAVNSPSQPALIILGVGFQNYYTPTLPTTFQCLFSTATLALKTTIGVVVFDYINGTSPALFLRCPLPVYNYPIVVTISIVKANSQIFPFAGFPGSDVVTFVYNWNGVTYAPNKNLIVSGNGFTTDNTSYRCIKTGINTANQTVTQNYTAVSAINSNTLDCGPAPTWLASPSATFNMSIYEVNATTQANAFQVPMFGTVVLFYNPCYNGIKDSQEIDVDCGGSCSVKCGLNQACSITTDCVNTPAMSCYARLCTNLHYWSNVSYTTSSNVIVAGSAFNASGMAYKCIVSGFNSVIGQNTQNAFTATATNSTSLNCGPAPNWVSTQPFPTYNLSIYEVNPVTQALGYQVPPTVSSTLPYDACHNGFKDGFETVRGLYY